MSAMIGVIIPCQHYCNDGELCEADRDAIVEAISGEPMTRDYPGSGDSWECITISECPNGCLTFSREFHNMEVWAVRAAQDLVQGEPPVLGEW